MKMLTVVIDGTNNIPGQRDDRIAISDIHEDDIWMFDPNIATNALLIWRWMSGEGISQAIKHKSQKYRYYGNIRSIQISNIVGEVIYFNGVGASGNSKIVQQITGSGTSSRIRDAYRFLAERHDEGTKISLFGFSRGAYAVRSLAGLIEHVGLPKNKRVLPEEVVDELFAAYRGSAPYRGELMDEFQKCSVDFLGAFDTVGSLALGDTANAFHKISPKNIKCFRHALALDERRRSFKPDFFENHDNKQDVEEVWFAGAHSNIGGGYSLPKLSSITLIWMIREFEAYFSVGDFQISKHPSHSQEAAGTGPEDDPDKKERRSYIRDSYDELLGVVGKIIDFSIGHSHRTIPDEGWHKFHPSVYEWLQKGDYCPIAKTNNGNMVTIDVANRRLCSAEDWPLDEGEGLED